MSNQNTISDLFFQVCAEGDVDPETLIRNAINFFGHLSDSSARGNVTALPSTINDVPTVISVNSAGKKREIHLFILYPEMTDVMEM